MLKFDRIYGKDVIFSAVNPGLVKTDIARNITKVSTSKTLWEGMLIEFIQIAIVTGGNSGIGFETVKQLLNKNAKVYLCARNPERANAAIAKLRDMNLPGTVEYLPLDLASLDAIKSFADNYLSKEKTLDMLFNNAGVMNPTVGPETKDGYELHVGTNSLGHHYLTKLLLPALQASAQATPDRPPRVCFTSSLFCNILMDLWSYGCEVV
ncbi:hypothetical protein MCAP1_000647 [Malassezia caprae]|uniref:Uncharacterized protein n=1 Tax=Malassezia caprae TaxID=1381934 RepID=A0AAF0IU61_9BASI|nr:hypothetical protein MCAP1_000647 [Malassezia caprae]